jgi:hypothetical protein
VLQVEYTLFSYCCGIENSVGSFMFQAAMFCLLLRRKSSWTYFVPWLFDFGSIGNQVVTDTLLYNLGLPGPLAQSFKILTSISTIYMLSTTWVVQNH